MVRIEADHRHLVDPVHDEVALGCGDSLWVWREVPLFHIRCDCRMAPLKRLVEEMNQLVGILGQKVLGLGVECVRNRYGNGYVLAFIREVPGWAGSLGTTRNRRQSRGGKSPYACPGSGWLSKGLGLRVPTFPPPCTQSREAVWFASK